MKWTFLTFSAVFFITLVLFLQDAEIKAGVERLSEMKALPQPTLMPIPI
jgi:hypothetical protein